MSYVLVWENGTAVDGGGSVEDLGAAKRLASELSTTQQGVIIRSAKPDPDGRGAWVDYNVAHYRDGKPYPAHWVIDLDGLKAGDREALEANGGHYRHSIDAKGVAFLVEVESEHDARAVLDRALPGQTNRVSVLEVRPATDKEVIDDEMDM